MDDLSHAIQKAYGPDGLGILVIRNVPGFVEHRRRLLPLAREFAALPDAVKQRYEDTQSHYSVGWSHGRESLASGSPDLHKGSFYANPLVDDQLRPAPGDQLQPWLHPALLCSQPPPPQQQPDAQLHTTASSSTQPRSEAGVVRLTWGADEAGRAQLRTRYPGYLRPNVWPRQELPELEGAFKELGRLVVAVGCLLAEHCDRYVAARLDIKRGALADVLRRSLNPKARLLHYFAPPASHTPHTGGAAGITDEDHEQPWCGWHLDNGSLTGLTSAMYLDAAGREVPCPDPAAGLYARDRHGRVVRVAIPADCLAFQVGEALQVASGGLLSATPHYVRAARGAAAAGVSRNTFACFMQPDVEEPMTCPPGVPKEQAASGSLALRWSPGITFGEFSEATFGMYYQEGGR